MNNLEQDLTTGKISKKLIHFALPLFGANLLQSFYSLIDMLVVGRVVGSTGFTAISNASMISFIINSICIGVTMGGTVLIAQYKGANKKERVKDTVKIGLRLNIFVTLVVIIGVQVLAKPIIWLFDPLNIDVVKVGLLYLRICCSVNSLVYAMMYTYDSFAIGIGSAKIAMINALLDAMLIRLSISWFLAFI